MEIEPYLFLIYFQMMKHAWDSYEKYAWGSNELRPISRRGHSASIFGASSLGATIIDALDTLYIMELDEEFKKGRDWVATSFKFEGVSVVLPPVTKLQIMWDFDDNCGIIFLINKNIWCDPSLEPSH